MININILKSGIVTGDAGKFIAYENQSYSDLLRFSYPQISGTIKKVKYTWGTTQCVDILDSNDCVRIAIQGSGIVRMQFVMEDPIKGTTLFASNVFNMLVGKSLTNFPSQRCKCSSCEFNEAPLDMPNYTNFNCNCNDAEIPSRLDQEIQLRAEADCAIWDYLNTLSDKISALSEKIEDQS